MDGTLQVKDSTTVVTVDSTGDLGHDIVREGKHAVAGGGYADVWRGTLKAEGSEDRPVALKFLRLTTAPENNHLKRIAREVRIWSQLEHPNVLPYLGLSTRYGTEHLCMVSPWQSNGHVMQYLGARYVDSDVGHSMVLNIICDLIKGISFLHNQPIPIVHGDLKGANVLVAEDGTAMLTDFGLSRMIGDIELTGSSASTSRGMSIPWTAPERMHPQTYLMSLTPASDIFSLGMTIYEILSGHKPFAGLSNIAILVAIVQGQRPPAAAWRMSPAMVPNLLSLMTTCYASDPEHRPRARDIRMEDDPVSSPRPRFVWQGVLLDGGTNGDVTAAVTCSTQGSYSRSILSELISTIFHTATANGSSSISSTVPTLTSGGSTSWSSCNLPFPAAICLWCCVRPKNGSYDFCSPGCAQDARQSGPGILEIPEGHAVHEDVMKHSRKAGAGATAPQWFDTFTRC